MYQTYHQIQSGLALIKHIKSFITMCDEDKKKMCARSGGYHYVKINNVADLNPHVSRTQISALISAAGHVIRDTQSLRERLKERAEYMFVHNMSLKSQSAFHSQVISSLELQGLSASMTMSGGPYELRVKEFKRGYRDMEVTIPCHWHRTVYDRGLHLVNANDGPRVVISAAKKKVERLNDLNIQVFKGQAMGFKKRAKRYWLHDAWIMKHEGVDGDITALHEDFTKAEQLINRRIRKAVTEALNV